MAVRPISEYPEAVLDQIGEPVEKFDSQLERLTADMYETMYHAGGVGLAAPQIGLSLRLFVMDCEGVKLIAANPEIIAAEGEQGGEEGCLSVGKVHAPLRRAEEVTLRAQDLKGNFFERTATGLAARCFLHETDHCDGRLFVTRLSPLKRATVIKRFLKLKKQR